MDIRMISTRRKRKFAVLRCIIFSIIIWFAFIFMTTGSFMKPDLLMALALCISMSEDTLGAALTGFICGFLSDLAVGNLTGSGSLLLILGCVCTSLLFTRLLRQNLLSFTVISAVYSAVHFLLEYFFNYYIWEFDTGYTLLTQYVLPEYLVTMVSMVAVYPVIRKIRKHLTLRKRYEPEDNQALIKD